MISQLKKDLRLHQRPEKVQGLTESFRNAKDEFIGVSVPNCRLVAKKYWNLSLKDVQELLSSDVHEEREVGLMILVLKFTADKQNQDIIYKFYLKNLKFVDNWDLVDGSAYSIAGSYLLDKPRNILYKLARSKNIWERRISIVATMAFIRKGELDDTFKISEMLLNDKHDLIQKAVGWLLREAGKKDEQRLINFLKINHPRIPRVTLRYAIERFPEGTRRKYLKGSY